MLVLTVNKGDYIGFNEKEILVQIQKGTKNGVSFRILDRNENGNYVVDKTYFSPKDDPISIDDMKIIHIKGTGKQIKIGFEGPLKVDRCPKDFKFKTERPPLDDFDFNFDTEDY